MFLDKIWVYVTFTRQHDNGEQVNPLFSQKSKSLVSLEEVVEGPEINGMTLPT